MLCAVPAFMLRVSSFPFETQTNDTNSHRLSRTRVSLGGSRLLSLAIVDKEHIAIGSEAPLGGTRKSCGIGVGLETI